MSGRSSFTESMPSKHGRIGSMQVFKIVNIDDDVLECVRTNVHGGSSIVYVAKSHLLRRTPFDGNTRNGISYVYSDPQTRVATNASTMQTETEVIVPSYQPDDLISAQTGMIGGTGITGVKWQDVNYDGRAWASQ